jgi:dipeptidyl aminopeptidase/acylaminoacyl peptidase
MGGGWGVARSVAIAGSVLLLAVGSGVGAARAHAQPSSGGAPAGRRPLTFDDAAAMRLVGDPHVSPDGRLVLYRVTTTSVAANRRLVRTYLVPSDGSAPPRPFPDDTTVAVEARFSPDGRRVAWVHGGQLWVSLIDGSARRQLTRLWGGVSGPKWAPGGDRLAFTSRVYPGCATDACNADSALRVDRQPSPARAYDRLLYRHWDTWDDGTRQHLYVVDLLRAESRDLVRGLRLHVPPPPFGGSDAYDWSHDGQELAFTARAEGEDAAWTTDLNVYTVPVSGGAPVVITGANRAGDQTPVYSRDGRWIAYASQRRPGFEAAKWRLMLYDRYARTSREIAPGWDYHAERFMFVPSNRSLLVEVQEEGRTALWELAITEDGQLEGNPERLVRTNNSTQVGLGFQPGPDGALTLVWVRDAMHRPPELWTGRYAPAAVRGQRVLTRENDGLLAPLELTPAQDVAFTGAGDVTVHGFLVRPARFDSTRRWPLLLLVHGGPQGAWLDAWNTRWNAQLFAAMGMAVLALNPRGSTGYGQRFIDEVSRDWGGKVYEDLLRGVDSMLARHPWLDSSRVGAAGGSFGGYMVNWMNGRSSRFAAFASHAGIFNLEHFAGATDELWFPEWEFGGVWWNRTAQQQTYRRWSPHLLAGRMRTPTLVLHGEQDFRVPYTEGTALFTALQRQRVPSRLVLFPDEGHWITRPANQRVWWDELARWFERWLLEARPDAGR